MVCQTDFDGYKDAINRRLYRKSIRQLVIDALLVRPDTIPVVPFLVLLVNTEFIKKKPLNRGVFTHSGDKKLILKADISIRRG